MANEDGFDFFVLEDGDGQVWMDIVILPPTFVAARLMRQVANYAHNVGKVFIAILPAIQRRPSAAALRQCCPAPSSLAPPATLNRTSASLRATLDLGISLQWNGHMAMMPPMLPASSTRLANTTQSDPEIANARFDFDTGTFRDAQGQRLSDEI